MNLDTKSLEIYKLLKKSNPKAAKEYFDKYQRRKWAEGHVIKERWEQEDSGK